MSTVESNRRRMRLFGWLCLVLGMVVGVLAFAVSPAIAQTTTVSLSTPDYTLTDLNGSVPVEITLTPGTAAVGAITLDLVYAPALVTPELNASDAPNCTIGAGGAGSCGPANPTELVRIALINFSPGWNSETVFVTVPLDGLGTEGQFCLGTYVRTISDTTGATLNVNTDGSCPAGSCPDRPADDIADPDIPAASCSLFTLAVPTPTPEPTATNTPVPTPTNTPEPTATNTPVPTPTETPTPTPTETPTPLPTATPTNTPLPTATPTPTETPTPGPTATPTNTPVATATPLPTETPTPAPTATPTNTPEPTLAPTTTPVPTNTPLPTATPDPNATATPIPVATATPIVQAPLPADPGSFAVAPDQLSISDNQAAFVVPDIDTSALGTGGGDAGGDLGDTGAAGGDGATSGGQGDGPGLAATGSSPLLATISVMLLTLGGILTVGSRRDGDDD
ncbi:MAG: hypothetical protein AAF567_10765 [Actinomycetota bacterium]